MSPQDQIDHVAGVAHDEMTNILEEEADREIAKLKRSVWPPSQMDPNGMMQGQLEQLGFPTPQPIKHHRQQYISSLWFVLFLIPVAVCSQSSFPF
jgi:hypothetical protein